MSKMQQYKPPFVISNSFLILDMEVIHTDYPEQIILPSSTTGLYVDYYPYMIIEKKTVTRGPDWVKLSPSYEKWREGVGEFISSSHHFYTDDDTVSYKRKPDMLTKSMEFDNTEADFSYLQADVNSFEKAELEYYASFSSDQVSPRFTHISLCHQTAIGTSYTMQECCKKDPTVLNQLVPLRTLNPYQSRVSVRVQIAWKSEKIQYQAANTIREMFTLNLMDPDDESCLMDCVVWDPNLFDCFHVGQIVRINKPNLRFSNKMYSNISDYKICINNFTEYTIESAKPPESFVAVESLSNICLKYIASYFSITLYTRELLKENEPAPLYLSPRGTTPLDVLTTVPYDLLDSLITKHLSFFSIFDMYYSGKYPFITSTFYSMAIRRQELGYCNMLTDRIVHIRESNEPYALLLPVYNNLHIFKMTKRDRDEIELPKLLTNTISDDSTYNPDKFPITGSVHDFRTRFHIFTGGLLEGLDWQNIFCAGGSVLASLIDHVPPEIDTAEKLSEYYLTCPFSSSDIDLFLWGEHTDSVERMKHIYQVVTKNLYLKKKTFFMVRSATVVTIVTEYPYRHVQIVDRKAGSPSEILLGFDLDCVCVGYDGNQVWALPKAIRSITRKYNLVDPMRCDNTFEHRAIKYCTRGFSLAVPGLKPDSQIEFGSVLTRLLNVAAKATTTSKPEEWTKELKLETTSYGPNLLWGPHISVDDNYLHVRSAHIYEEVYDSWTQLSKVLYSRGPASFILRRARNFGFRDHPLLQAPPSVTKEWWKLTL